MAEKKLVKVFMRRPADDRNVKSRVVGVNGKMYTVPYDKEVEVPPEVAEVINASIEAQKRADEMMTAVLGSREM